MSGGLGYAAPVGGLTVPVASASQRAESDFHAASPDAARCCSPASTAPVSQIRGLLERALLTEDELEDEGDEAPQPAAIAPIEIPAIAKPTRDIGNRRIISHSIGSAVDTARPYRTVSAALPWRPTARCIERESATRGGFRTGSANTSGVENRSAIASRTALRTVVTRARCESEFASRVAF